MAFIARNSKAAYWCAARASYLAALLLLPVGFASAAPAEQIVPPHPTPTCPVGPAATYQEPPANYPLPSDRYAVQYRLGGKGGWTDATVHISEYGATDASPYRSDSGYTNGVTSMSFVSIPAGPNEFVQLRVTLLSGSPAPVPIPFLRSDRVSVRPTVKWIPAELRDDGTVQISTFTGGDFNGEQFLLWWQRNSSMGGGIQGLAFFLDPSYQVPNGTVKTIWSLSDLDNVDGYDTLDIEGQIKIGGVGNVAYAVPANIVNIYLGPGAWVQGKLEFPPPAIAGQTRSVTGPGVLDVSRFQYNLRACKSDSDYPDQGIDAIVGPAPAGQLDHFDIEGIIIADTNHAATGPMFNSYVNNVKTISWNGVNGGLKFEDNTTATNVFVRSGDDSLMVWGSYITVKNATVWQNYNGGVVNLGWSNNSTGIGNMIDGLFVAKTDWQAPNPTPPNFMMGPSFTLGNQNNAVIASMLVPGTTYGSMQQPARFQNIFVEDRPQVLLSLKILPPDCDLVTFDGGCPVPVDLRQTSALYLNIKNLFTPPSIQVNSIGFENLMDYPNTPPIAPMYTLMGTMNINLTNVFFPGKIDTNGTGITINYSVEPF
jgi:hypothetical protein